MTKRVDFCEKITRIFKDGELDEMLIICLVDYLIIFNFIFIIFDFFYYLIIFEVTIEEDKLPILGIEKFPYYVIKASSSSKGNGMGGNVRRRNLPQILRNNHHREGLPVAFRNKVHPSCKEKGNH